MYNLIIKIKYKRKRGIPLHTLTKNDLTGHDVFEFMTGVYAGTHWLEDSLYISEDLFQELELKKIFDLSLKSFSYFGITIVTQNEWENTKKVATQDFPLSCEIIKEIDDWAKVCFEKSNCFTICGI